jgi:transposase
MIPVFRKSLLPTKPVKWTAGSERSYAGNMKTHTPPQIAKMLGVSHEKVMTWIRNGELTAFNAATRPDLKRPRYRITEEWLQGFIRRRSVPTPEPRRRPKCPTDVPGVIQFIKPPR